MPSLICAEELAYREIRQRILDGRLLPGTRLVHRGLARELVVSPNPVVLALRMLERDGLVTNTPGLGACVRIWTAEEIVDLYMLRAFQEALASRLCAERATEVDLDRMTNAGEAFKRSIDTNDVEANIQSDMEFHTAVVQGAHSPDLERTVENLSIIQCSMKAFAVSLKIPRLMSEDMKPIHDPIVQAIVARDADAAESAGRDHVEKSLARNLRWLRQVSNVLLSSRLPHGALSGQRAALQEA